MCRTGETVNRMATLGFIERIMSMVLSTLWRTSSAESKTFSNRDCGILWQFATSEPFSKRYANAVPSVMTKCEAAEIACFDSVIAAFRLSRDLPGVAEL